MMRAVGFIVESISSLKVLGPLLARGRLAGVVPFVFIPDWRKGKPYDAVTRDIILTTFSQVEPEHVIVYGAGELVSAVSAQAITMVCLLNPYRNFVRETVVLREAGIQVYGLDYFANSLYVAASRDDSRVMQQALEALEARLVTSPFWRDLEFEVAPAHQRWAAKFFSLGTPLTDVFPNIDHEAARRQLGVAAGTQQPIVCIFTPNIRDHQAYFFYGWRTRYLLRHLAKLVREYCDRHHYLLVVKSRAKQWDAEPFRAVADVALDDLPAAVYPSTSALLLAGSALALHFGSMMVMEAAAAGIPSIGFGVPFIDKLHGYMRGEARRFLRDEILAGQPGTLFSFGEVSQSLSVAASYSAFETVADRMIGSAQYAQKQYKQFNARFSGWEEGTTAAERILAHVLSHHRITAHHT